MVWRKDLETERTRGLARIRNPKPKQRREWRLTFAWAGGAPFDAA
jgi:hypothetical protein